MTDIYKDLYESEQKQAKKWFDRAIAYQLKAIDHATEVHILRSEIALLRFQIEVLQPQRKDNHEAICSK